jgi:ABC-type amino acid transport substrate-binding protein
MISGKRLGFEKPSTSERLAVALERDITVSGKASPELHAEERPAAIIDDVRSYKIDVGITDLPFAVESILTARQHADHSLDYRRVDVSELPASIPDASRFDEYAIAIRRGDQLLPLINQSLRKLKESGDLARMIRATVRDYEQFKSFPEGALASQILHEQPWMCKE